MEEVGFEPTNAINVAGFQDQCHQPLDHSSLNILFLADMDAFVESRSHILLQDLESTTGPPDSNTSN